MLLSEIKGKHSAIFYSFSVLFGLMSLFGGATVYKRLINPELVSEK